MCEKVRLPDGRVVIVCGRNHRRRKADKMALGKLKPESGGGDFVIVPSGNHPGVLVAIVDLGTQEQEYKGVKKSAQEVFLCWELPGVEVAGTKGVNHVIGKGFTYSFHEKSALRGLVEKWRSRKYKDDEEFNPGVMLGQPCLVNVSHAKNGDKTYSNFDGVSPVIKGLTIGQPQHKPILWEIETGDLAALSWLPRSYGSEIKDIVQLSPEWKARVAKGGGANGQAPANPVPSAPPLAALTPLAQQDFRLQTPPAQPAAAQQPEEVPF
jgi:hypothetical protein